jgi:hypothetical protein
LAIRDNERAECAKTLQRLVGVLLGSVLVDWSVWEGSIRTSDLLRLPDEVLEEVALVLCEKEVFGLLDYIAEIGDQITPFS